MPTELYKQPKRSKKAYNKRAKVYARQYDHSRKKSALYQSQVFYSFGSEHGLISSLQALTIAVQKFNTLYQDTLNIKHGFLILCVKHYVTLHKVDRFHPDEIRTFYSLQDILGYFAKDQRSIQRVFNDLVLLDFCNHNGHKLMPTTRVKIFHSMYQNCLKELFNSARQ